MSIVHLSVDWETEGVFCAEVTDSKIVTEAVDQVVKDFGRLDIFVSRSIRHMVDSLLKRGLFRSPMPGW